MKSKQNRAVILFGDGVTIYYSLADDEKAALATLLMNTVSDIESAAVSVN